MQRIARIGPRLLTVALSNSGLAASAHVGNGPGKGTDFAWSLDVVVLPLLIFSVLLYGTGAWRLYRRSHRGRAERRWRTIGFLVGWSTLMIALVSPLDTLSGSLFSAHMVQHELMMIVAAPLLVIGRPLAIWLWALPRRGRAWCGCMVQQRWVRAAWNMLTQPMVAWVLHAVALWGWHMPFLFETALRHPSVHIVQHASFLASTLLFWTSVVENRKRSGLQEPMNRSGVAMLSLFTTMAHTTALGALLTLAPGLWYPSYSEATAALGFDPLEDQQLGGVVMWVPGGVAYLIGGLVVAARWLLPLGNDAGYLSLGPVLPGSREPERESGSRPWTGC